MKKILALLLAAVFTAAVLAACGDGEPKRRPTNATEAATEAQTEEATEAPTEEVTEAPTEAPTEKPTQAPTEKPKATDTSFEYSDPAGAYQVTVPEIWNNTGMIVEDEYDGNELVRFVYKDAYYEGAGNVFTIVYVNNSANIIDVSNLPHGDELYNDGSEQIYVIYPTDVQFGVYEQPGTAEFNKQQAEYSALSATREDIIKSFRYFQ